MSDRPAPEPKKNPRFRELWIELRTSTERIEGAVRVPSASRCRRIGDIVHHADRDETGILHLVEATVFDARTNAVKFHRRSLGVNRQSVIFAAPLEAPLEGRLPWSLPPKSEPDRVDVPDVRVSEVLNN